MKENKRLNLGLDEYHATYSRECPVYQNKLMLRIRRINNQRKFMEYIQIYIYIYTNIYENIKRDFILLFEKHVAEKIKECESEKGLYDQYLPMSNSPNTNRRSDIVF